MSFTLLKILLFAYFASDGGMVQGLGDVPVYTARVRTNFDKCMTECESHHGGYYYCYVNANQNWDYCSPYQKDRPLIKKAFTLSNGPCKTPCSWNSYYQRNTCDNYWGTENDYCDTKIWEYLKTYTYKGNECVGDCDKHGRNYYWCYDENKNDDYCSPNDGKEIVRNLDAQMKEIRDYFRSHNGTCRDAPYYISSRPRRQAPIYTSADSAIAGSIVNYAVTLAALGTVGRLVSQWQPTQPIYRYAYYLENNYIRPLMISAHINDNSIQPQGSRDSGIPSNIITNINRMGRLRGGTNNDENGHLIAYQNGGPNEVYNFAPQPRSLNRGIVTGVEIQRNSDWRRAEDGINEWVRRGFGYVDQTVVVVYDSIQGNPRPVGFGQHIIYYNRNDVVQYQCSDFYSNDPDAEPVLLDQLP